MLAHCMSWSDQAEADLQSIGPVVRDQLRRNAEEILHLIPLWHRGDGHAPVFAEQDDGPQNYFLLYRERRQEEFEVLAVRSIRQMVSMWKQIAPLPPLHWHRSPGPGARRPRSA